MKKGFTLVEILVVIVIIGVLIAIVLPNATKAIASANLKGCAANLRSIDTAANLCYAQTKNWGSCDTTVKLATLALLEIVPVCPVDATKLYTLVGDTTNGYLSDKKTDHFGSWPDLTTHK